MKRSEIIEELKKRNPYPADIFPEVKITVWNFLNRRDAMFGSWGGKVWQFCIDELCKIYLENLDDL